jgi:MerR family transcriptional regulator, heat shock protein HspR
MTRQPRRRRDDELFEGGRGVFMISVAAELAGMHPQTLRVYEARGLIKPSRSPKKTRLYSREDVERLKRIQELTNDFGLNLAGVEQVLSLESAIEEMQEQLEVMRARAREMEREMLERIEAVHRSYKRELVRWEPPGSVLRAEDAKPHRIKVERSSASNEKSFGAGSGKSQGTRS